MGARWVFRSAAVVGLLAVMAFGGCSSDGGPAARSGGGTTSGGSSSDGSSSSASSGATSASPTRSVSLGTAQPPECTTDDLSVSYRMRGAAAGTTYGVLSLTNTSDDTCFVEGYGGLSYVGGSDGKQVGAPARREHDDQTPPAARVTLQPGDAALSRVGEVAAENFDADDCDPTPVDGFRVYPPDQTASLFVKHADTGCADRHTRLLLQRPYR